VSEVINWISLYWNILDLGKDERNALFNLSSKIHYLPSGTCIIYSPTFTREMFGRTQTGSLHHANVSSGKQPLYTTRKLLTPLFIAN